MEQLDLFDKKEKTWKVPKAKYGGQPYSNFLSKENDQKLVREITVKCECDRILVIKYNPVIPKGTILGYPWEGADSLNITTEEYFCPRCGRRGALINAKIRSVKIRLRGKSVYGST